MNRVFLYAVISLVLILLQTTFMKFLAVQNITPDIIIILVVYIAIREGQISGTVAGFLLGLAIDILSGNDGMLGLSAMTKTVVGFVAGYFYNENRTSHTLGTMKFVTLIAVGSLMHNVVYFTIFLQGSAIGWWGAMLHYGIPSAVFTTAFALIPMFVFSRKYLT